MEIRTEHYQHMKQAILGYTPLESTKTLQEAIVEHRNVLKTNPKVKNVEKQLRWDLAYVAKLTPFFCSTLYQYLNDEHIDTALKAIMAEIEAQ